MRLACTRKALFLHDTLTSPSISNVLSRTARLSRLPQNFKIFGAQLMYDITDRSHYLL